MALAPLIADLMLGGSSAREAATVAHKMTTARNMMPSYHTTDGKPGFASARLQKTAEHTDEQELTSCKQASKI